MGCTPNNGGISLGRGSRLHDPRPGLHLWHHRHTSIARHGHSGQANCTSLTLAEWLCRTVDRIDPPRVLAPRYMIRDRDRIYGTVVTRRVRAMGIRDKPI